jgi:excisionase family DNA binding protein
LSKLLTPEEVAEALAVSRSTARRMMIENVIPSICLRSGRRKKIYRVREEQLERFIVSLERQRQSKIVRNYQIEGSEEIGTKFT